VTDEGINSNAQDSDHPASCLLTRRFQKLAVWVGVLVGIVAFFLCVLQRGSPSGISTIWAGSSWELDIVTGLLSLLLAGLVGWLFWGMALAIGGMACDYRNGTRLQKAFILAAIFAGLACFVASMCPVQRGWPVNAGIGLLMGALVCVFVLALGQAVDWVLEGFRLGMGFRRLTIPAAIFGALLILGCIFGVEHTGGLAFAIAVVWWLCGIRRDMAGRLLASRVGWFAGITAWLIVLQVVLHGEARASREAGYPWIILVPIGTGIIAWIITLIIGQVRGRKNSSKL